MGTNIKVSKENLTIESSIHSIIHVISYALILLIVSFFFDTLDVNNKHVILYSFYASCIIYILNITIKPILFRLTIPITGLTLGLFYPCINVLILKMTDFILGNKFDTNGIITLFLTAILISIMNFLMENIVIKRIIRRSDMK